MEYSTFLQYTHYLWPGLHLTHTTEDTCDVCVSIHLTLKDPDLSDERRSELQNELKVHHEASRDQRRAVSTFTKAYASKHAPKQNLPHIILPDSFDCDSDIDAYDPQTTIDALRLGRARIDGLSVFIDKVNENPHKLHIVCENFGQSFTLPSYGWRKFFFSLLCKLSK